MAGAVSRLRHRRREGGEEGRGGEREEEERGGKNKEWKITVSSGVGNGSTSLQKLSNTEIKIGQRDYVLIRTQNTRSSKATFRCLSIRMFDEIHKTLVIMHHCIIRFIILLFGFVRQVTCSGITSVLMLYFTFERRLGNGP